MLVANDANDARMRMKQQLLRSANTMITHGRD